MTSPWLLLSDLKCFPQNLSHPYNMHWERLHTCRIYTNDQNRLLNYKGAFKEFTYWKHRQPIRTSNPFSSYLLNSKIMKTMKRTGKRVQKGKLRYTFYCVLPMSDKRSYLWVIPRTTGLQPKQVTLFHYCFLLKISILSMSPCWNSFHYKWLGLKTVLGFFAVS